MNWKKSRCSVESSGFLTVQEAYRDGKERLKKAGVPEADLDAWYLLEYATGLNRAMYYAEPGRKMEPSWCEVYEKAVSRREKRIPLQHITGVQEFMGLTFQVNADVLIPRQDTEILAEEAVRILAREEVPETGGKIRILDLCTGSGCILLSVLHYAGERAEGTGADLSGKALAVAEKNAGRLGIKAGFVRGDLFEHISGKFGIILSNPPYIRTEEIESLQDEVRLYDPREALDGMEDGLYFYRRIVKEAGEYLEPGGRLIFEIGHDQAQEVTAMMEEAGYTSVRVKKDLAGLDRVICGVYS